MSRGLKRIVKSQDIGFQAGIALNREATPVALR